MTSILVWDLVFVFENVAALRGSNVGASTPVQASSHGNWPGGARTSVVPGKGLAFPVPPGQTFNLLSSHLLYATHSGYLKQWTLTSRSFQAPWGNLTRMDEKTAKAASRGLCSVAREECIVGTGVGTGGAAGVCHQEDGFTGPLGFDVAG